MHSISFSGARKLAQSLEFSVLCDQAKRAAEELPGSFCHIVEGLFLFHTVNLVKHSDAGRRSGLTPVLAGPRSDRPFLGT